MRCMQLDDFTQPRLPAMRESRLVALTAHRARGLRQGLHGSWWFQAGQGVQGRDLHVFGAVLDQGDQLGAYGLIAHVSEGSYAGRASLALAAAQEREERLHEAVAAVDQALQGLASLGMAKEIEEELQSFEISPVR